MTNKVNQPGSGQRKVTVRELVESELDLIIGGGEKKTETKTGRRKENHDILPDHSNYQSDDYFGTVPSPLGVVPDRL